MDPWWNWSRVHAASLIPTENIRAVYLYDASIADLFLGLCLGHWKGIVIGRGGKT